MWTQLDNFAQMVEHLIAKIETRESTVLVEPTIDNILKMYRTNIASIKGMVVEEPEGISEVTQPNPFEHELEHRIKN